jgi:hypothetical protein
VTFGDTNWEIFNAAITLRDRVTHPKGYSEIVVHETELQTINTASEGFKTLQNDFVRMARAHRTGQGHLRTDDSPV